MNTPFSLSQNSNPNVSLSQNSNSNVSLSKIPNPNFTNSSTCQSVPKFPLQPFCNKPIFCEHQTQFDLQQQISSLSQSCCNLLLANFNLLSVAKTQTKSPKTKHIISSLCSATFSLFNSQKNINYSVSSSKPTLLCKNFSCANLSQTLSICQQNFLLCQQNLQKFVELVSQNNLAQVASSQIFLINSICSQLHQIGQ